MVLQNSDAEKLHSLLEILVITFNRCHLLDNTLQQLLGSPFASCKITILDNCSADDTQLITARYKDLFPDYHIIRNNKNIGGDHNYLKAVEQATAFYTWVLCDDDNYDFSHAESAISVIVSCKYDLIYVSSRSKEQLNWDSFGETNVGRLIEEGANYHRAVTFFPAIIFRPEHFDCYCFFQATNLFPSMPFINKTVRYNLSIFVSQHEMVIRSIVNSMEMSPLYFFKEWAESLWSIDDVSLRGRVIEQCTDKGFLKTLAFWISLERSKKVRGYWKRLIDIFIAVTPRQRLKLLLLLPLMLIPLPLSLLLNARKSVYLLMGQKDLSKLPPTDYIPR
jgi:glycosyltransferase involved in cell wall biosynthesis